MKAVIYIPEGKNFAMVKNVKETCRRSLLEQIPNAQLVVAAGNDGEFAEWQIYDLLAQIQLNQKTLAKT